MNNKLWDAKILYYILKNSNATYSAVKRSFPMKYSINLVYFVKGSTNTKILLQPCDRQKSVTKSMLQEVNLDVVIGNGCKRAVSKDVESLVFLQISQVK